MNRCGAGFRGGLGVKERRVDKGRVRREVKTRGRLRDSKDNSRGRLANRILKVPGGSPETGRELGEKPALAARTSRCPAAE